VHVIIIIIIIIIIIKWGRRGILKLGVNGCGEERREERRGQNGTVCVIPSLTVFWR